MPKIRASSWLLTCYDKAAATLAAVLVAYMRTVIYCFCVIASTTFGFAQPPLEIEFTNANAELVGTTSELQFFHGTLVSVGKSGQPPFLGGMVGTVTFTTPPFGSGDTTRGGRFGPGGSFFISSPWDVDVNATFVSGSWRFVTLQNKTHNYVLKARIVGTMFLNGVTYSIRGAVLELSANTGTYLFGGSVYMGGGVVSVVAAP